MKTNLLGILGAAALIASSAMPASALVIVLGTGIAGETLAVPSNQSVAGGGSYLIDYTFTLSGSAAITDATFSLTSSNTPLPSANSFKLYSGSVGSGTYITDGDIVSVAVFPKVLIEGISSETLAAGNYFFESKGVYTPTAGTISVGGSVTLSAVPEVSTWAMMFLGFAALGFAGFRSRRSVDLSA